MNIPPPPSLNLAVQRRRESIVAEKKRSSKRRSMDFGGLILMQEKVSLSQYHAVNFRRGTVYPNAVKMMMMFIFL